MIENLWFETRRQYMPFGLKSKTFCISLSKFAYLPMVSDFGEVVWDYSGIDFG